MNEKTALLTEHASLKGIFASARKKEIEEKISSIDAKLKNM